MKIITQTKGTIKFFFEKKKTPLFIQNRTIVNNSFGKLIFSFRSRKAWNPLDPNNQGNSIILGRIFSNTLEQFVLFVSSTLILSIYLTSNQMSLIPILVITWVIGRMLFDFGYQRSPLYRTPGFILSGVPTLASLSLISYLQFYEGPWIFSFFSAYFGLRRFILFLFYNDASPITLIIG